MNRTAQNKVVGHLFAARECALDVTRRNDIKPTGFVMMRLATLVGHLERAIVEIRSDGEIYTEEDAK